MTDNRTTELLKDYAFALRRLEYAVDKPGSRMTLGEYEAEEKRVTDEYAQAIAATLGEKPRDKTEEWLLKACNQATQDYVAQLEQERDELKSRLEAATLGAGECEMETDWDYLTDGIPDAPEDTWAYMCSSCDWSFRYDRGIKPSYCPNCGRAVKHG